MTLETETVLDRRNLRRRVGLWRGIALAAGALTVGLVATYIRGGNNLADSRHIARVTIDGMITEDRDMLRLLKRLSENKQVQGVIFSINSPGGTTTGGEAMFEAIREVGKTKPVVAQFGTVAASAAYIAGLATDHIVARGNSITGSVGVLVQWPEFSGLLEKVGVKMNEIKSGPLKAVPSMFEPVSPEGRKSTEAMIAESQQWFLGLVRERRGVTTSAIPGLEQGRIYSGREALQYKLVDAIGGEAEAIKFIETKAKGAKELRVVDWRPRRQAEFGWLRFSLQTLAGLFGSGDSGHQILNIEKGFNASMLDGFVSVWQPAEK
jgi:protease IV